MSTYIIAEIGINHNGNLDIAKKLIDIAVKSNVDAVKFQKRTIEKVYSKELLDSIRESPWGTTQRDQKLGLEFDKNQYDEINKYCKSKNIDWLASAWDLESLDFLDQYNLQYNKIASAMIVDEKFVKEVAKKNKHTFISTGMSTEENISNAVSIFRKANTSFELMHCVSTYPMDASDANLLTIEALKKKYSCDVGYSGHEPGVAISLAAVALGATSIERHITLDRSMYGSDQAASLESRGLGELVGSIKKIELAIGEAKIGHITKEEKEIAIKLRAHLK
ncbi:N-acetylneuraminate synthase family protein [Alphaproteobacteria bacterium]|nr:N-acetylneuraminate synthase family protein [Alphaproteobacteria bacterium]